ncbi:MAG: T9SS type A sorting domain-containing protein, partial [candidate division KSB1 bacterium]|nr:T9SS type A sorting domain-containing protein [candidate division KSB1 bacterium]
LLKVSIQALKNNAIEGEIVAIEDVPNDQGKQVTIIWDKFVDDGVAVDPVAKYIVKRQDGEVWVGVGEYTAHGADRYALVVPTLYDSTAAGLALTTFKVVSISQSGNVHESLPAQGYSVDNLVPHAPGNFMAMVAAGNVELSWEAPADPDINYYKVFRSTDPSFVPSDNNLVGTTVELKFTDKPTSLGSYYYVVAAVDFSGNLGEFTHPVNATLTSIDQADTVPLTYELYQNYPNPFNPETSIKFSLKAAGNVSLTIYNSAGQMVKKLIDQEMAAGNHSISFIADGMSSGVYIYRIVVHNSEGNQFQAIRKMILMK